MPKRLPLYKIVPRDGLYYVVGYVGNGKYMQLSEGFKAQGEARDALRRYEGSERSAKAELRGGSLTIHT